MLKPEIHKRVKELIELAGGTSKGHSDLKDDLDYLRVCIKYYMFDLEASRRELREKNEH
ncbi:hypothetical protein LCGC14_1011420 [marine sediment metagenome]|uniref:Uncharacterized protein n=1 Tax=marine sediment metagenome TaxID=412755 RepID=A0A0F9NLK2_9ZZZZ